MRSHRPASSKLGCSKQHPEYSFLEPTREGSRIVQLYLIKPLARKRTVRYSWHHLTWIWVEQVLEAGDWSWGRAGQGMNKKKGAELVTESGC